MFRPTLRSVAVLAALAIVGSGLGRADDEAPGTFDRARQTLLLAGAHAGGRLVAVGDEGSVLLSDDQGASWRLAGSVPTRVLLTDVFFLDPLNGWAVGHDATILRTVDGGETWTLQWKAPELNSPLMSIWMADLDHGIAVGAFGLSVRTADGGAHWKRFPLTGGADRHLNAIFPGPGGSLFVAAESGNVFRSDDGGNEWIPLELPYPGSLWGGLAPGDGGVLVYGMRGHVLRSDDAGIDWREVDSGTDQSLGGGLQLDDGRIVLVGLGGAVAVSADGGRSFRATIRESRHGANGLAALGDGRVLLFGEGGVVPFAP